jgi:hypothetical protein
VETLRGFADRFGITYRLLSDEGSATIRRLGLLNRHITEQQAYYGKPVGERHKGLPYPGTFLLDERGVVTDRRFEQSYRVRPTAPLLLEDLTGTVIGPSDGPTAQGTGLGEVATATWTHDATYRPMERVRVHVCVGIPEGVHVYGRRSASTYTPLEVRLDAPDDLEVIRMPLPADEEMTFEGLGETAYVHTGRVCTHLDVTTPDSDQSLDLRVEVSYQACTDTVCHPPDRLTLSLRLDPRPQAGK